MNKPEVQIKNWQIRKGILYGEAIDHPRFKEGTNIRTSPIVEMDMLPGDGDIVETLNTRYKLLGEEVKP